MENGHETWNLEGEELLLVRATTDSCRIAIHLVGVQEVSWQKGGTE
jgi:hypothetical protein